jgi:hypothetical protein
MKASRQLSNPLQQIKKQAIITKKNSLPRTILTSSLVESIGTRASSRSELYVQVAGVFPAFEGCGLLVML